MNQNANANDVPADHVLQGHQQSSEHSLILNCIWSVKDFSHREPEPTTVWNVITSQPGRTIGCLLGEVYVPCYLSHARWSYRRRLGSLLLWACVQEGLLQVQRFQPRTIPVWNYLPAVAAEAPSLVRTLQTGAFSSLILGPAERPLSKVRSVEG